MYHNKKIFEKIISKTKIYLIVIAILLIALCVYHPVLIIPSLIVYILIIIYAWWTNSKGQEELTEHIKNLTFSVDKIAKMALINSPFPLIIAEIDEKVAFKNTKFIEEFANIDINHYVGEILKNVKVQLNNNKQDRVIDEVTIDKKTYQIYAAYTSSKQEKMITVYFIDVTKEKTLEQEFNDKDSYVGLIMIDNYEENIQRLADDEKTQSIARVEKAIYDWVSEYHGLALKSERDTFVCIIEKKKLQEIREKKFDILDFIKEEQALDKVQFTLSIAMSNEGKDDAEKYKSARSSIGHYFRTWWGSSCYKGRRKISFLWGKNSRSRKKNESQSKNGISCLRGINERSEQCHYHGTQ